MSHNWIGVDFGAQKAGTTAICFRENDVLRILQSEKGKSADSFLENALKELNPQAVFIDAPLSLPLAYFSGGDDYMYRECDRLLGAMSPMFLGGLTARAIRMKNNYLKILFYEAYPAQTIKILFKEDNSYKKDLCSFSEILTKKLPHPLNPEVENWHQADAVLTWLTGWRYFQREALIFGDEKEGLIYV